MANTLIGSDYIVETAGDSNWLLDFPAEATAGDIAVVFCITSVVTATITDSFQQIAAEEGASSRTRAYWKVLNGSEGAQVGLNFSDTTNGIAYLLVFRNTTSQGWSESDIAVESTGTTNACGTLTTKAKGLVVAFFAADDSSDLITHTTASGYTELQDRSSDAATNRMASVQYKLNAGSSEAPSSTASASADYLCNILVYLEPTFPTSSMLGYSF